MLQQTLPFRKMAAARYILKFKVAPLHQLEEHVCHGTLAQELDAAIAHCRDLFKEQWFNPAGAHSCAPLTFGKFSDKAAERLGAGQAQLESAIVFGGSVAQIDLNYRACDMKQLDLAKMKFLAGEVKFPEQLQKAVGPITVQGESVCANGKNGHYPIGIKRLDSDFQIDVICLICYWNKDDQALQDALKAQINNAIFSAEYCGDTEAGVEIERFSRYITEDKKKDTMGRSSWNAAMDLMRLVTMAGTREPGVKDAAVAAKMLLDSGKSSLANWKEDTCERCPPPFYSWVLSLSPSQCLNCFAHTVAEVVEGS